MSSTTKKVAPKIVIPKLLEGDLLGLVDRDKEVKQLMYALLTREHMLIMGPPGLAKSQLAMNSFAAIDGAKVFEIHLTKQTTEEYVFGPINITELKKGNVVHNTSDSLLDADFAFIDEFFDASDVLLRSLLGVLNERVWMKGAQKVKAQLHSAILTSNYQRENEITEAILDRIIFKATVQPTTEKLKRIRIYEDYLKKGSFVIKKLINLKELQNFSQIIEDPNTVNFPKDILQLFDLLLQEYMKETKKYISQRTANKALKVLKVAALLDNRSEVSYADLEELKYVFCVVNDQMSEQTFDAIYEKHVGKAEEERLALKDLKDIEIKVKKYPTSFAGMSDTEFIAKMREINELIHLLETMQTPTQPIVKKRDGILNELRQTIERNRNVLFEKKTEQPAQLQAPSDKNDDAVEGEYIEDSLGEDDDPQEIPF